MNLENLKTSFGNVASAAGYDTEAIDAAGEKIQGFLTKGKALGKKMMDAFQDKTEQKVKTEELTVDPTAEDTKSKLWIDPEISTDSSPDGIDRDQQFRTKMDKMLEKIREDVDIEIDEKNRSIVINSGSLTGETTDVLRDYLKLKVSSDLGWNAPDLMIGEDVPFDKDKTFGGMIKESDYPDFTGMKFGDVNIQSQGITDAENMFAGVTADTITIADQPNLVNAKNMFGFTQANEISVGKIPDDIDVSFDMMNHCPSDVSVDGTMYEVSDATKAEIEDARNKALEMYPFIGIICPGFKPDNSASEITKLPYLKGVFDPGMESETSDQKLSDAESSAEQRVAQAKYFLGVDTDVSSEKESSVEAENY